MSKKNYRLSKIILDANNPSNTSKRDDVILPKLILRIKFSAQLQEETNTALQLRPSYKIARVQPSANVAKQVSYAPIEPVKNNEIGWRALAIILLFAATATTGIYFARQYINSPITPLSSPEQIASLASTIFTGTIKPVSEIKITATSPAIVQEILVKVGDQVIENQPLLKIDDREAKNLLTQAELEKVSADQQVSQISANITSINKQIVNLRNQVAAASGKLSLAQRKAERVPLRQRQDSPERAQAVYEQALSKFQRTETLHKQGLVSAQELDELRSQLRIAEADLKTARAAEVASSELSSAQESQSSLQNELVKKEQQQQLLDLQNQLERAQLRQKQAIQALEIARQRTFETIVKATRSGAIVEIPVKIGDQIIVGTTLARLAQLDKLIVEVPISARLINSLKIEQSVNIKLPTSDQSVVGKIITINPLPAANLNHIVEVEFDNTNGSLLSGQPAEVKFGSK
ncbi:MAG: HlyD family efflux transporter periplasmic adaptor subunit [Acidobacteria bacterium]|nr:HlyD family efflux transporter periplasmic adaptor subunit [Acidobacteriota bacterium]